MGCDIHMHIEVKLNGEWHHYGSPNTPRAYRLFEIMAGVRGDDGKAVSLPKGMPSDPSAMTNLCFDYDGADGHSHSWLSRDEIKEVYRRWDVLIKESDVPNSRWEMDLDHNYFGYAFSNSWEGNSFPKGVEDVRFVFWFDN